MTPTAGPEVPHTGDLVIDAALSDLGGTSSDDLDAALTSGESLLETLRTRLSDLEE